ncbi:MAG: hypothetical protein ACNS62_10530 [Candidatus Cyclobacteriaceae bacterium M3_2C_046]
MKHLKNVSVPIIILLLWLITGGIYLLDIEIQWTNVSDLGEAVNVIELQLDKDGFSFKSSLIVNVITQ